MSRPNSTAPRLAVWLVLALLGAAAPSFAAYSLVWSDEFDGTSLDTSNWNHDIGDGCPSLCGWGNNELEYYRAENVSVSGGHLVIEVRDESFGGRDFTSGKIHTAGKRTFRYGRIEMRAKLPTGGGVWPAFWMMPEDDVYGGWAASGELDIMESANATTSVGGALHYGGEWPNNTSTSDSYSLGGTNFADDFHVYAVEWEPDEIRWYVDGVNFMTRTSAQWYSDAAPGNPQAPFDQAFYIILNAAVGGWYTGCTDASCVTADLPQQYLVDYVRVYEDIDNALPTVSVTAPAAGATLPAGDITITADAADSDGSVAVVEFYAGAVLLDSDTTAPYSTTWTGVGDGCYALTARAIDDLGGEASDTVDVTVGLGCGQLPYGGAPPVLPVRVEAEDFDAGGPDVAYHDASAGNSGNEYRTDENVDIEICADTGGGYNVGWTDPGEWLEYTVEVPADGAYLVEARVASQSDGGAFHVEFGGVDVTGSLAVPVTGAWQAWQTVTAPVTLTAGVQVMRLAIESSGFNLNYLDLVSDLSDVPEPGGRGHTLHPCRPNPFNPMTSIVYELAGPETVTLSVLDLAGRLVRTLVAAESRGAGRHETVWNGRDADGRLAAAGVYLYRLQAGATTATRRMTLVK